jgi:hypothetical protein
VQASSPTTIATVCTKRDRYVTPWTNPPPPLCFARRRRASQSDPAKLAASQRAKQGHSLLQCCRAPRPAKL